MNPLKTLLALITLFPMASSAQTIFAPAEARWHYYGESSLTAGPDTRYCLSEVKPDTIILGRSAAKITTTCYNYNPGLTPSHDTFTLPEFFTYTSGDTVFYYNREFEQFYALYRFDVLPGDTITYHIPTATLSSADTLFRVLVDSVTLLNIAGAPVKNVWTTPLGDFWFHGPYAERLGALSGAGLMAHEYTIGIPRSQGLRCYADNLLSYNPSTIPCDFLPTDIKDVSLSEGCWAYPNPVTDLLVIRLDKNGPWRIYMTDVLGRLKYDDAYTADSGVPYTINMKDFSPGIYNLVLKHHEHSFFVRKIVKPN